MQQQASELVNPELTRADVNALIQLLDRVQTRGIKEANMMVEIATKLANAKPVAPEEDFGELVESDE